LDQAFATVQHPSRGRNGNTGFVDSEADEDGYSSVLREEVRQRLAKWEAENPAESEALLTDAAHAGELSNSFTRPLNVSMAQFEFTTPLFQGDELSDLRSQDAFLKPGDLVEMRYGHSKSWANPPG
jgi:hypothetical protein